MLVPAGSRYCHSCSTLKELTAFHRRTSDPEGRTSTCRVCTNANAKKRSEIRARLKAYIESRRNRPAQVVALPEGVPGEVWQ